MRKIKYIALTIGLILFLSEVSLSQVVKNKLILGLGYYNNNNRLQYLKANTKAKLNGKFQQVAGIHLSFYITVEDPANLLGRAVTNERESQIYLFRRRPNRCGINRQNKPSWLFLKRRKNMMGFIRISILQNPGFK